MQLDRIYIDSRSLDLPPALPPGTYTLTLTVYRPWDNVRLTLSGSADRLLLERLTRP